MASSPPNSLATESRSPGRGEQLAVVAEALRADVGAVADDAAVLVGGLLELPVDPAVLDLVGSVVLQIVEVRGDLHDLAEPAFFDGLDVGETASGRLLGLPVGQGVVTGVDVGRLDLDVRVLLLVLRVELVESHRAERGDGQRDRVRAAAAVSAAG